MPDDKPPSTRFVPDEPLPPYAFVPGGRWPHPVSEEGGHLREHRPGPAEPIEGDAWPSSRDYLFGVDLFNAGYYWEAHEVWERLWNAHKRSGPVAELLKGLIKLAAAGVKVRQGQPHGVVTHARRAAETFGRVRESGYERLLGLSLVEWVGHALAIAEAPPMREVATDARTVVVFDFEVIPRR